jgi:L-rhamnose mutarotase
MERLMFTFALSRGQEEEYDRRHREVWPALLHDLYEAGWRNYSLFRRDLQVYAYAECHPDAATALARMSSSEANREWARWFEGVIEQLTGDDGRLFVAPEVWHMDEEAAGRQPPGPTT